MDDRRPLVRLPEQAGDIDTGDIAGGNIYNGVSSEHIVGLLHELIGDVRQYRSLDQTVRQRRQDEQDIYNKTLQNQVGQLQASQRLTNQVLIVFGAILFLAFVVAMGLLIDRVGVAIGLLIGVGIALRAGR